MFSKFINMITGNKPPTETTNLFEPSGGLLHDAKKDYVLWSALSNDSRQLTTDGRSPTPFNVVSLPDHSAAMFSLKMIVYNSDTHAAATWSTMNGLLMRQVGPESMTMTCAPFIPGPCTTVVSLPTITADVINGGFDIRWQAPAGMWLALVNLFMVVASMRDQQPYPRSRYST